MAESDAGYHSRTSGWHPWSPCGGRGLGVALPRISETRRHRVLVRNQGRSTRCAVAGRGIAELYAFHTVLWHLGTLAAEPGVV